VLCERATRFRSRGPVSRAFSGACSTHSTRHRQGSVAASRQLRQTEAEAQRSRTLFGFAIGDAKLSKIFSSTSQGSVEA